MICWIDLFSYIKKIMYSPENLTWNLKMMVSKRNLLFQGLLFRDLNFRGVDIHSYQQYQLRYCQEKQWCKFTTSKPHKKNSDTTKLAPSPSFRGAKFKTPKENVELTPFLEAPGTNQFVRLSPVFSPEIWISFFSHMKKTGHGEGEFLVSTMQWSHHYNYHARDLDLSGSRSCKK